MITTLILTSGNEVARQIKKKEKKIAVKERTPHAKSTSQYTQ